MKSLYITSVERYSGKTAYVRKPQIELLLFLPVGERYPAPPPHYFVQYFFS